MMKDSRYNPLYRLTACFVAVVFTATILLPPGQTYAQVGTTLGMSLPAPGTMVPLSQPFAPAVIKGIKIFPDNPLRFDFIIDTGDTGLTSAVSPGGETKRGGDDSALRAESSKLIKYFLASLTVPEEDLWVNLSPYEKDRIIPDKFGETEMGRDLLAQDYLLKQITSSLMYPEDELGQKFWDKIYQRAYEEYGTTEIPVNTFNKVWIVPEKAVVYENGDKAFIVESKLKVMLEEDYVAMEHADRRGLIHQTQDKGVINHAPTENNIATDLIREIILPALEKEVNEGTHFANLRQIYHSMILATWFKRNLVRANGRSPLQKIYIDQNKTAGIDIADKDAKHKIYDQYIEAFKKGVYNYIKEDYDPNTKEMIPRKYFSGGARLNLTSSSILEVVGDKVQINLARITNRNYVTIQSVASPIHGNEDGADSADLDILPSGSHLNSFQTESLLLDSKKSLDGRRKAYKKFSQIDIDERILKNLDLTYGDKVLDLGTGSGTFLPLLSKAVGKKGSVVGVDIKQHLLSSAKQFIEKEKLLNVSLARADLNAALPFANDSFDAIASLYMIYYINNLDMALAEVKRVLKHNGKVLFVGPGRRNNEDLIAIHKAIGGDMALSEIIRGINITMEDQVIPAIKRHFGRPKIKLIENKLTFKDKKSFIDYVLDMNISDFFSSKELEQYLDRLEKHIEQKLKNDGEIVVRKFLYEILATNKKTKGLAENRRASSAVWADKFGEPSWENPKVQELADDLAKNGLKNFRKLSMIEKLSLPNYMTFTKNRQTTILKHKEAKVLIIVKNVRHPAETKTNTNELIKKLSITKRKHHVPIFFIKGEENYYVELNLVPFGYKPLNKLLKIDLLELSDNERQWIAKAALDSFRFDSEEWFLHGHLHPGNILVKLDKYKRILDVKFIDFRLLETMPVPEDIQSFITPEDLKPENANWKKVDLYDFPARWGADLERDLYINSIPGLGKGSAPISPDNKERKGHASSAVIDEARKILKTLPHLLTIKEEQILFQAFDETEKRDLKKETKDFIILSNLRLVNSIANKYEENGMETVDFFQEGILGLHEAVDAFEYQRGNKFSTYATWRIRRKITMALTDTGHVIRVPVRKREVEIPLLRKGLNSLRHELEREPTLTEVARRTGLSVQQVGNLMKIKDTGSLDSKFSKDGDDVFMPLPQNRFPNPAKEIEKIEEREFIENILRLLPLLPVQDRVILKLRFGIGTREEQKYTHREIEEMLRISHEWVRQRERKAIGTLRWQSRRNGSMNTMPTSRVESDAAEKSFLEGLGLNPDDLFSYRKHAPSAVKDNVAEKGRASSGIQDDEAKAAQRKEQILEILKDNEYTIVPDVKVDPTEADRAMDEINSSNSWQPKGFRWTPGIFHRTLFVKNKDGKIVGYLEFSNVQHITTINVHGEYQGRGIGLRLMIEGLMMAKREKQETVDLHYERNRVETLRFYHKLARIIPVTLDKQVGHFRDGTPKRRRVFDIRIFDEVLKDRDSDPKKRASSGVNGKKTENVDITWEELEKEGYHLSEPEIIDGEWAPKILRVNIYNKKGKLQNKRRDAITFEIFPKQKAFAISLFAPNFPIPKNDKDKIGRGRAVLTHLFKKFQGFNFFVHTARTKLKNSLQKMKGIHLEIRDWKNRDESIIKRMQIHERVFSGDVTDLNSVQLDNLSGIILTSDVHGFIPVDKKNKKNSSPVTDLEKGGIDLNPANLDLETTGEGAFDFSSMNLPCIDDDNDGTCERVDIEGLENMNIDGFTPVIFQIVPVTNLPLLLGINEAEEPFDSAQRDDPQKVSSVDQYRNRYYRKYQDDQEEGFFLNLS